MNEFIKENPNYLNALVNLANLKNETYFFDEAIQYIKKALKIKKMPELYLNISNILQTKIKWKKLKKTF